MIFKGLDGTFCGIGAVQVGWYKLKSDAFLAPERFEGCWSLVVQYFEGLMDTALVQIRFQSRLYADEFVLTPQFHRLRKNDVAIMVIKYHDILSAATGCHQEIVSFIS